MTMRSLIAHLGFAALRANIRPPKLKILTRYQEQWMFKNLLNRLGITLLLDVGANNGKFAEGVRLTGYRGRIVSFEPNPAEHATLSSRASRDPYWSTQCCALGDAEGTVSLNITGSNSVYSSILTPKDTPPVSSIASVPVHRLDALWNKIAGNNDRVFLKTDTQGYDLHVLQGAGLRLTDIIGIQTELNVIKLYKDAPHYLKVLDFLESNGFSVMELRPIGHTKERFILEFDCFAARASAFATATR